MKLTTGLDIIEIDRVANSLTRPRFLRRVFSREEREMLLLRGNAPASAAANFAAKEAFAKAMGTGLWGFSLEEVSVLRDKRGAPFLHLTGRAAALAAGASLSVSLTHTKTVAAAVVTALWEDDCEKENGPCML